MFNVPDLILSNLIYDREYATRSLPLLKKEYFKNNKHKFFFELIKKHIESYDQPPTIEGLNVVLTNDLGFLSLSDESQQTYYEFLNDVLIEHVCSSESLEFKLDQTEEYCKYTAVESAVTKFAELISERKKTDTKDLEDALAISFGEDESFDLIENLDVLNESWKNQKFNMKTNIDFIDRVLGGGIPQKGLFVFIANTGVGKSTALCHLAAELFRQGKIVLFISMELDEKTIQERILQNILKLRKEEIKEKYQNRTKKLKEDLLTKIDPDGKMITVFDSSGAFDSIRLQKIILDQKIKFGKLPDVIMLDHLSKMKSGHMKRTGNIRGDEILGEISKEVRNISGKYSIPIFSAEQTNRHARNKLVLDATDIAKAWTILEEADAALGIGEDEAFREAGEWLLMCLKTRFSDLVGKDHKVRINKNCQLISNIENLKDSDFHIVDTTSEIEETDVVEQESRKLSILHFKNSNNKILENI